MKTLGKSVFVLWLLGLSFMTFSFADLIPENSHRMKKCVMIQENPDLKDINLRAEVTWPMVQWDEKDYDIEYSTCLSKWYKFNSLKVILQKSNKNYDLWTLEPYGGYVDNTNPLVDIKSIYQVIKDKDTYNLEKIYEEHTFDNGNKKVIIDKRENKQSDVMPSMPKDYHHVSRCVMFQKNTALDDIHLKYQVHENDKIYSMEYNICLPSASWWEEPFVVLEKNNQDLEKRSINLYRTPVHSSNPLQKEKIIYQVIQENNRYALEKIYEEHTFDNGEKKVVIDKREIWDTKIFLDVKEWDVYADSIKMMKEKKIIQGYSDGEYKPSKTITRAEFTKILIAAKYSDDIINSCTKKYFSDVYTDDWYNKYICMAKKEWIIKWYPDGTFKPNKTISYAEASKIALLTLYSKDVKEGNLWYVNYINMVDEIWAHPKTINTHTQSVNRWEAAYMIALILDS